MKKFSVAFALLLTFLLAVALYNTRAQRDTVETVTMEEMYSAPFPNSMPDVCMGPMIGFAVY